MIFPRLRYPRVYRKHVQTISKRNPGSFNKSFHFPGNHLTRLPWWCNSKYFFFLFYSKFSQLNSGDKHHSFLFLFSGYRVSTAKGRKRDRSLGLRVQILIVLEVSYPDDLVTKYKDTTGNRQGFRPRDLICIVGSYISDFRWRHMASVLLAPRSGRWT